MKTEIVTPATGEPITLEEIKRHLRIEVGDTAEDDLLLGLVRTARERVEAITNRALMPQTWYVYQDRWPATDFIDLPYPPLRSVPSTGIVYTMSTGNSTTYNQAASPSTWSTDTASTPGRIVRNKWIDSTWPTDTLANNNPIRIELNAGYSGSTAVPDSIKTAMKLMVGHWYENREDSIVGQSIEEIPQASFALLYPYRNFGL